MIKPSTESLFLNLQRARLDMGKAESDFYVAQDNLDKSAGIKIQAQDDYRAALKAIENAAKVIE